MLTYKIVSTEEEFLALEDAWDDLVNSSSGSTPYQSWIWNYNWWKFFASDSGLFIVLVYKEGEMIGIAPFISKKRYFVFNIFSLRTMQFIASSDVGTAYSNFIIKDGWEEEFATYLGSAVLNSVPWDLLQLNNIDESTPAYSTIRDVLNKMGYQNSQSERHVVPYLELPESFEIFLAKLSGNKRKNFRRSQEKLAEMGTVTLEEFAHREPSELLRAMEILIELNKERFLSQGISGGFLQPEFTAFHREIIPQMARKGQNRLFLLLVNSEPIGAVYLLKSKNRWYGYQTGFGPDWMKFSPGTIADILCIKYGLEHEELRFFDLGPGAQEYKYSFHPLEKHTLKLTVFNKNLISKVAGLTRRVKLFCGRITAKK